MVANTPATETVHQVALVQSKYWKCIVPKSFEPHPGTPWFRSSRLKPNTISTETDSRQYPIPREFI